jgi:hypothetical protein
VRTRLAVALIGLVVMGMSAIPNVATARTGIDTRVTIKTKNGDFWGFIYSSKPKRCAKNRKVVLYHQLGATQHPKTDEKVASDTSSLNGTRYEWSTGNTGRFGKFYARAPKTPDCRADSSDTVRSVHTP